MPEAKGQYICGCACLGVMVGAACLSRGGPLAAWRLISIENVVLITPLLWAAMVLVTIWIIKARVPHQVSWARGFALVGPWVLLFACSRMCDLPARLFGVIGQSTVETTVSVVLLL